jgi:hypothetical protein
VRNAASMEKENTNQENRPSCNCAFEIVIVKILAHCPQIAIEREINKITLNLPVGTEGI